METIIETQNIVKHFSGRKPGQLIKACDDVSLTVQIGKTLGLVGESGCGKTTVGRIMIRLLDPDSGSVFYRGTDLVELTAKELRPLRKNFQMIFQDSRAAFNPRMRVYDTLKEAIRLYRTLKTADVRDEIKNLTSRVNLHRGLLYHFVGNLSGGELKRLDIARALSIHPDFIIADEPLALLDMSIQSQIVSLLLQVQQEENTAILFISQRQCGSAS